MNTRHFFPLAWVLAIGLFTASPAHAFNWMIRHGYTSCAACHVDPSGSGLLTQYGRAQFELLVAQQYGEPSEDGELSPSSGFAFGAAQLPDWLNASLALRGGGLMTRSGGKNNPVRPVLMVTDARAALDFGRVKASATLGVAIRQAEFAALTAPVGEDGSQLYLTSREHWLGYANEDQTYLIRAGRVNQPFGLRNLEHTAWVREYTQTDINQDQQHGLAIAYNGEGIRGEFMAIAGNFQVKPDIYRDRGYSLFVEKALAEKAAAGVSSRVTFTERDIILREATIRQSHGVFARVAPFDALAVTAELNALVLSPGIGDQSLGYVGWLQGDLEVVRGLHFMGSLETVNTRREGEGSAVGGWLSTQWYFAPHSGLRLDGIVRRFGMGTENTSDVYTLLFQIHSYL